LRDGGGGQFGVGRVGRDHQQAESLWARGGETLLVAILDVVGFDAVDGVEELGILVASHCEGSGVM
jgi:hypothetical protein